MATKRQTAWPHRPKSDLLTECRRADPDFEKKRIHQPAYEWSNGRDFEAPRGTGTSTS